MRRYIAACPLLADIPINDIFIDRVSENISCGIIIQKDTPVKRYISGGELREYGFLLQTRLDCTDKRLTSNAEWVEHMQNWCAEETKKKHFPELPCGCTPVCVSAEKGSLSDLGKNGRTGIYSIQFKLTYIKSGGKKQ